MEPESTTLCALSALSDPGARGFRVVRDGAEISLFVVRRGDEVHAYVNSCPHTGVGLDWVPHRFLDEDGRLILCATHGAVFRIEDGECVAGPCVGRYLTALPVSVSRDGRVVLLQPNPSTSRMV